MTERRVNWSMDASTWMELMDGDRPRDLVVVAVELAPKPKPIGPERWHGTINGYTNHKCRCWACRECWATYHRKRVAQEITLWTETIQATAICAICGFPRDGHDYEGIVGEHEFQTVDEFLHRVPGAYDGLTRIESASMPDSGRMEYLDADLERAARLYWLTTCGSTQEPALTPFAPWLDSTTRLMREMLVRGQPLDHETVQWRILTLLNIPLKYYASSASREAAL